MAAPEAERCELAVVGAGLAAAHLVARLPDRLLKGTVVIDAGGSGWLGGWADKLCALGAPHVRTPHMQHPHAQPLALKSYAEKCGRQQELTPVAKGFASVPSLDLFRDFVAAKVVAKLPAPLCEPRQDRVLRIEKAEGKEGPACLVHLASGKVLAPRAVIYTPANRQPVLPAWVQPLLVHAQDSAAEGTVTLTVPQQQQQQQQQYRLPAGIATSDQVDLRHADLAGRRVVVVGGGMSAGLLAAGAAERGATVTLVCRRPLVPQPFETEVGWWGARELNGFRQLEGAAVRLRACQRARRQGSVHLPVWRRLVQQAADGRLTVMESWEVATAEPRQAAELAQHAQQAGSSAPAWRLAVAQKEGPPLPRKQVPISTLFEQAVAATAPTGANSGKPASSAERQEAGVEQEEEDASPQAPPTPPPEPAQQAQRGPQQAQQGCQLDADLIWLACGRAYDAASDPVLSQLHADHPTLLAAGYAQLDDDHLCWPGAPVYVMGRGAMLSVGPAAGDMPGTRLAADRILASLQRLDYADAPAWDSAAQRLLDRLHHQQRQQAGVQASTADALGSSSSGGGGKDSGSDSCCTVSASDSLAAAVAAATAALPALPLEAEGCMWMDPKPKVLVSKPDNLIDVSDLDPALPRKELSQYKFTDDDFEICVICQLYEAVPLEQVRVLFGQQHLEMWAVGEAAAYHLHLPKLYNKVITKKCSFKVNKKAKKVYLMLQKESDAEWRFLKG